MDWWNKLNSITIGGNELWRVLALFFSLLIGLILGRIARFALLRSASAMEARNRPTTGVAFRAFAKVITFAGFVVGLQIGVAFLTIDHDVSALIETVVGVLLTLTVAFAAYSLVDVVDDWMLRTAHSGGDSLSEMIRPMVRTSLRITVAVLAFLQIAQLLTDKPLTSIIAGLGVGGLAIALAAQDTVKNFFGSLVIFADKPFQLGERVVIDGFDGPVEEVGFRSTRIRTLEGHQVTVPNGELANKTIQNIGRRPHIRYRSDIALASDTTFAKVECALEIIRSFLKDHEGMKPSLPPRVWLSELPKVESTALKIVVSFWYHPPEYWRYMEFCERFNLHILKSFEAEGIKFASAAQTVHFANAKALPN